MNDRANLFVGGIATLIGGVGAIVVNILHPRPPQQTHELLALVATMPHWIMIHYGAAFSAALVIAGFALLVRTIHDPFARALGEAGKYIAALGAAAFIVAIMVDGYGYPNFAERWMAAAGTEKDLILAGANAVHVVDAALFPVWSAMFLGLGITLIAAAQWQSGEYPRLLAVVGVVGSLMCLVFGASTVFHVHIPFPLWPVGPGIDGLWMTLVGATMLTKYVRSPRKIQSSTHSGDE